MNEIKILPKEVTDRLAKEAMEFIDKLFAPYPQLGHYFVMYYNESKSGVMIRELQEKIRLASIETGGYYDIRTKENVDKNKMD